MEAGRDRRGKQYVPSGSTAVDASPGNVAIGGSGRRRHLRGAIPGEQDDDDFLNFHVAPQWVLLAPVMFLSMVLMAIVSGTLPSLLSATVALVGIGLVCATPLWVVIERKHRRHNWRRYLVLFGAVGAPTALFGFAAARWTYRLPGLDWDLSIAVLVLLGLIATALLNGRIAAIATATIGLWLGASIFNGSTETVGVMLAGGATGLYLTVRQGKIAAAQHLQQAQRERAQRRAEELLSEYEATGQGWFWETDRRGTISYVSPRIARLVGTDEDSILGRPFTDLFVLDAKEQESERTLNFHLSTRSSFQELQVLAATDEPEERWWSITGRPVMDKFNNFLGFRGSGSDLTETRKSQRHVTQLARFDSLTMLANRFQMSEWLEKVLNSPRVEDRAGAIFLLDLDRFKQVNDTMGHPAGDALLKQVADRLRSTVGDGGRVGRLGGDEFQIILPGHTVRETLGHLAKRIIENLSHPYSIDGQRVTIGASIGIAVHPEDGITSEELIRNADLALYAAKDGGRGRFHFYAQDLHSDAQERQQVEQDLRDAITRGDLELYYQPQVHTKSERITGFEALLRWRHPVHGYLSPAKFVPIAEDAGLIALIGEWALRTACQDLSRWPDDVRVAVNVSPLQFSNPALPAIVTNAVAAAGISPSRLELEITESVFLNDDKSTEAMFTALKRVGVRLALDDFGTGYSSLGYLKKAPFDKIKIDQGFVRGATIEGSRNGAIISSIVSLAEALGMETTAEGVETMDELDLMRTLGCSHIQGYIYEQPLDFESATARLETGLTAVARGPRSARSPRQTMLRKILLEHGSQKYQGTIRNISTTGAMIEGLWNVPVGTEFSLHMSSSHVVKGVARWCKEDRMGIEFAMPLELDHYGGLSVSAPAPVPQKRGSILLKKAG